MSEVQPIEQSNPDIVKILNKIRIDDNWVASYRIDTDRHDKISICLMAGYRPFLINNLPEFDNIIFSSTRFYFDDEEHILNTPEQLLVKEVMEEKFKAATAKEIERKRIKFQQTIKLFD